MNWLKSHLANLVHAAADLVEQHPDTVITGLRFVAGVVSKALPVAAAVIAVVEQVAESEIKPTP